ncbi:DUF6351 family protein [Actinopolymorpha alba]|uniref:DUF6351 family protein n=1 Tax=Actinopolymorpha alba TaxID=533267 RepID=UPI000382C22B|nr:DUF6351 family protein [Actinopolymorpha alba]
MLRRLLAVAVLPALGLALAPAPGAVAGNNAAATSAGTANAGPANADASARIGLSVVSSRPAVVSGGDALVRVSTPADVPLTGVHVYLNGEDVTAAFRFDPRARIGDGLVEGLRLGHNTLTASGGGAAGRLDVTNHPITGPVFAGPHQQPFICDTAEFTLVTGAKLGAPLDDECSVRTRVDYVYRTTDGRFVPLPAGTTRPADLAWTTTSAGRRVPYVVRVETGTINRAIYETAILHDPESPAPDAWQRSPGWNGRLIYTFGGGCAGGWYIQGRNTGGVMDDLMLRQGYAVASASLNVFGNNCDDLLAAETMSMVKERFVEAYGVPAFTIGWGCSGGSYQVHQIGDNYPGLLDGIVAACSFPEVGFGTIHTISDARLLDHYFKVLAPGAFLREQQRAVSGFGKWESIANLAGGGGRIDPRIFCPGQLPAALRYDPATNPTGARCDVYSHTVNAYGRDSETGFARRPLDNVGIQYGLQALLDGTISAEQFLDLNARVGGFDADANHVAERTVADLGATRAAYRTGRLLNGGAGLATMPIIDYRAYTDDASNGDIHMRFQSFSTRARLESVNGTHANQVMLVEDDRYGLFSTQSPVVADALTQMDAWLTAIAGDTRPGNARARLMRNKPGSLVDACWTRDAEPRKIAQPQVEGVGTTTCNTLYPVWPSPRMVAGGSTANDIVACQRQAVDPRVYAGRLNGEQLSRLRGIFPDGVCDWSAPGIEQQGLAGTWLSFG